MDITKERLQEQLESFHRQLPEAVANVQRIEGAIQVVNYLINECDKDAPKVEPIPPSNPVPNEPVN